MALLQAGAEATLEMTVKESDLASALSFEGCAFPAVFATSRMVALMELAAARCLLPLLEEGQLSVGVDVNIRHLAASPVGVRVKAVATYLGLEGKLHRFRVEVFDEAGKVGEGEHTRAIIGTERLVAGAVARRR